MSIKWYIAHKPSKTQAGPLQSNELAQFCFPYKADGLSTIFVWCKGMEGWLPIEQLKPLASVVTRVNAHWNPVEPVVVKQAPTSISVSGAVSDFGSAKEEAPDSASFDIAFQNLEAEVVAVDSYPKVNRRRHPRADIRLKAILSNSEQTFMTYTRDISESGLCLEVAAPDHFFKNELDIILLEEKTKKRIKFKIAAVIDAQNPRRFYFLAMTMSKKTELMTWIENTLGSLAS